MPGNLIETATLNIFDSASVNQIVVDNVLDLPAGMLLPPSWNSRSPMASGFKRRALGTPPLQLPAFLFPISPRSRHRFFAAP